MSTITTEAAGLAGVCVAAYRLTGRRATDDEIETWRRQDPGRPPRELLHAINNDRMLVAGYEPTSGAVVDELGKSWDKLSAATKREFHDDPVLYEHYLTHREDIDAVVG